MGGALTWEAARSMPYVIGHEIIHAHLLCEGKPLAYLSDADKEFEPIAWLQRALSAARERPEFDPDSD